jgi:hypothetical protein
MTFRTPIERTPVAHSGSERQALGAWLDWHRATLLTKLAGLTDEQAGRRGTPTSGSARRTPSPGWSTPTCAPASGPEAW